MFSLSQFRALRYFGEGKVQGLPQLRGGLPCWISTVDPQRGPCVKA